MQKCIYCGAKYLYTLATNQLKCAKCKRKFSLTKLKTNEEFVKIFCTDTTASNIASSINMSYPATKKRYDECIIAIAYYLENRYQQNTTQTLAYGEYIYLEKSKRKDKKSILESYNFITFDKGEIYNLLLDSLATFHYSFRYNDGEQTYKEFNYFLLNSKISNITKSNNNVLDFWGFFEKFILKYKGISKKNFYYYLKLAEFFFNYDYDKRVEILNSIYNI